MVFIVIEMQSDGETASTLVNSYTNRNEAESKFHQILGSAAISSVPIHSAVMLANNGRLLKSDGYSHVEEQSLETASEE